MPRKSGRTRAIAMVCATSPTDMAIVITAINSAGSSCRWPDMIASRNSTTLTRQKNSLFPSPMRMLTSERAIWLPSISPALTAM
ncbi:hypothetical protein ACVWW3_001422 [Bradyrhizobium sp. LM2.9]